jgi:hypothetical protein
MFSSNSIKLSPELWDRIKRVSAAGGYSSPQEFVEHVMDRELKKVEEAESDAEIVKKLQGLGYID